ncbi:unnamed protein product [Adineta ricciae]|uniref:Uncharacterized protein n=1 Tax=Adineta ricciae TaxID=249248 RepID=A0A815M517_ADIRI|nr:unnamed protein product [Adineta ricciae]
MTLTDKYKEQATNKTIIHINVSSCSILPKCYGDGHRSGNSDRQSSNHRMKHVPFEKTKWHTRGRLLKTILL